MLVSSSFLHVSASFLCCFCVVRIADSVVSAACPWPHGGPQVSGWLPCAFAGRLGRLGGWAVAGARLCHAPAALSPRVGFAASQRCLACAAE